MPKTSSFAAWTMPAQNGSSQQAATSLKKVFVIAFSLLGCSMALGGQCAEL
jgi:hypothetical protein